MNIVETIPAGYHIHIETSENDYDHVKTEVFHFTKKSDVEYLVKLLLLFTGWEFGNSNTNHDKIYEEVLKIEIPDGILSDLKFDNADEFHDAFICDYIGYAYESDYYRVFESVKVMHYPRDVISYNLTGEFIK